MFKKLATLAMVAIATAAFTAQPARAVFLSDLISSHGSISVATACGTLTFSDFAYSATGDMPAAFAVQVNAIANGIQFQGFFLDLPGGSTSDALIEYTVTSTAPITGAGIVGNPVVKGPAGIIAVTDTYTENNNTMFIEALQPGNVQINSASTTFGTPLTVLHAHKDIGADSFDRTTVPNLSFVNQTYTCGVPEPTSLVLLGVGALGLVGYRYRRS